MPNNPIPTFFKYLKSSFDNNELVRITLSKPPSKQTDLLKMIIKPVLIKQEKMLSFVYRYQTKDVTKNYNIDEGIFLIKENYDNHFQIASLFTTTKDWVLQRNKKGSRLKGSKATFTDSPTLQHDKEKNRLIKANHFLTELGVTDTKGRIQKSKGDKYKQINKFAEILAGLIDKTDLKRKKEQVKVVDMGAGKGYLTFVLYDYLVNQLNLNAEVIGVEVRPDLINICNGIAESVGFENLKFEKGYINDYALEKTDLLIALHACDTATDDAIYKGIKASAELIICAPCCHKQIRREMKGSEHLDSVLNFGILKERQAEIVTDTIRALLLELNGYKTNVFEFISTEHTGKNLMIAAVKHRNEILKKTLEHKIQTLKQEFGIETHHLETLLQGVK